MSIHLISNTEKIRHGLSYWQVTLTSGKIITEGQVSFDLLRGTRNVNWYLDIASTKDCALIKEVALYTPAGMHALAISEPYTTFQLNQGMLSIMDGGRSVTAQIIGRVDDRETGECTCIIWDTVDRVLHTNHRTNVKYFTSWRRGTPDLKEIHYSAMGVRLLS